MNWINGYTGKLITVTGVIGKVDVYEDDKFADVSFAPGAQAEEGDTRETWLTVEKGNEYSDKNWPPQVGDIVTVIIPKVIRIVRAT